MSFVILGAGIAGVQCAEELARLAPEATITLVSANKFMKGVGDVKQVTSIAQSFKVVEKDLEQLPFKNGRTVLAHAVNVDCSSKQVELSNGEMLKFDKLCICTGASPKVAIEHPRCLKLRDQDTVMTLKRHLSGAKRVLLVGNGGIALELVHCLRGIEIVWAVKHKAIGDAFFDYDAAEFLKAELDKRMSASEAIDLASTGERPSKAPSHPMQDAACEEATVRLGHAVGPQWSESLLSGNQAPPNVLVETHCELDSVEEEINGQLTAHLTSGKDYNVDFIISATGVTPNTAWLPDSIDLDSKEGGILVDRRLESSVPGIFAAGDVCTIRDQQHSPHFFQMRLWTQAKFMGTYAAQCMMGVEDERGLSFSFELFTHVTQFLGKKVILLGAYNGQNVAPEDAKKLISYSQKSEEEESTFVRVLLLHGKMIGAVLIGDSDLEEAFQNLILDGLDISDFGTDILDPDFEIDHVFD